MTNEKKKKKIKKNNKDRELFRIKEEKHSKCTFCTYIYISENMTENKITEAMVLNDIYLIARRVYLLPN